MLTSIALKSILLANNETITYVEQGNGPQTMILIHGNMTSSKHWDILLAQLPAQFKIYAIDMRGFGGSSYHTPINALKDFSEDLKSFVDVLNLKSFSLVGWSTGGGVALQFAADYPQQVEKLVLIESVDIKGYPMFRKDKDAKPILGDFLKTKEEIAQDPLQVMPITTAYANKDKATLKAIWNALIYTHNQPDEAKYDEYLEDMLTQRNIVDVDYALVHFNMSHEHNGVEQGTGEIDKVVAPTLIIQGDRDFVVPGIMAESIAKAMGKKAKLVILENCGHSPLIDCLDRLKNLIVDFVKE